MKLVNNSVTYYQQEPGIDGMYKAIQKAAWVCYQTEKSKLSPREFTLYPQFSPFFPQIPSDI